MNNVLSMIMKQLSYILDNEAEVLGFLKARYPMYHLSNIFFRDIQYGIQQLLERKGMGVGYSNAEKIARVFVDQLMKKKVLTPIDQQSWVLNYPEFRKPAVKPAAPARPTAPAAKPVGTAPAAPRPAGGLPPLKPSPAVARPAGGLPPLKSSSAAASVVAPAASKPAETPGQEPAPSVAAAAPPSAPKTAAPATGGKTMPPLGARTLPPIKSSNPAGGKK